jgi:hypothetical protein
MRRRRLAVVINVNEADDRKTGNSWCVSQQILPFDLMPHHFEEIEA